MHCIVLSFTYPSVITHLLFNAVSTVYKCYKLSFVQLIGSTPLRKR